MLVESHEKAIGFYKRLGFMPISGRRRSYYLTPTVAEAVFRFGNTLRQKIGESSMNGRQVGAENQIHHPAYELAAAITKQSWLDAGMTIEELEHDKQIAEAFDRWTQAGHAPEDFLAPSVVSILSKKIVNNRGDSLIPEAQAQLLPEALGIPREIQCRNCHELAHLDVTQQLTEDEIAVRYVCPDCRWIQTRHYHASNPDGDLPSESRQQLPPWHTRRPAL